MAGATAGAVAAGAVAAAVAVVAGAAVAEPLLTANGYRPRALLLQWHLTERCNLRCAHCYQEGGAANAEAGFSDWLAMLDQYLSLIQTGSARGHITLTGGEPLAHRDLARLMEHLTTIRRPQISLAILTNGTLIDATLARQLWSWHLSFVQVSLDGNRATHDSLRGSGAFDRAMRGLEHLVKAKVTTMVSFTAQRGNFRQFPTVARLARELGVNRVWADRLIPQGSGAGLGDQSLTAEETHEFINLMAAVRAAPASPGCGRRAQPRTEIAMNRALQFHCGGMPYHCTAGDTLVTVMPNGDLYPCRRMPIRAGNLLETPFSQLYDCGLFATLRDRTCVSAGCENCLYAHLCGGGLRCLAFATTGEPFNADPGCWLANRSAAPARTQDRI
jgi:radical SAM protein with 4Fe4S-binding SPASM domain